MSVVVFAFLFGERWLEGHYGIGGTLPFFGVERKKVCMLVCALEDNAIHL